MILCYTEEQKQVIISTGMMVIEFKRLIHKRDQMTKVIHDFCDWMREFGEKMQNVFATLRKALRDCVQHIENAVMVNKVYKHYKPVLLYEKVEMRDHLCRVSRIYRCRNNC